MSLDFMKTNLQELKPRITVVGVGGAGGNAVNNMIAANLQGIDFVVANTDAQALAGSTAENRLQLGLKITQGLGAGSRPEIGRASAEEALDQIEASLEGSHMCFITAGMGGGTGTGAAPIVAKTAREKGILTVAVVTKPFDFEGPRRMRMAEEGIAELHKHVDTLIIIPNQNLFRVADRSTTLKSSFAMADNVLHSGVRSITDLMVVPGLINLDFADVRTVMSEMGKAMMGTGEADGDNRALQAAERAIANPLLDEVSLRGAKGVIINVTGGYDLTLFEVDEAANHIRAMVDPEANIIFGSAFDPDLEGKMRVSVVATGIDAQAARTAQPAASAIKAAPGLGVAPPGFGTMGGSRPIIVPQEPVAEPATAMDVTATPEIEPLSLDVSMQIRPPAPTHVENVIPLPTAPVVDLAERGYVAQESRTPLPEPVAARASLFERLSPTSGRGERTAEAPRRVVSDDGDPFAIPNFLRGRGN